jgi:hypothetical protein
MDTGMVTECFRDKTILITGSTGFLGKCMYVLLYMHYIYRSFALHTMYIYCKSIIFNVYFSAEIATKRPIDKDSHWLVALYTCSAAWKDTEGTARREEDLPAGPCPRWCLRGATYHMPSKSKPCHCLRQTQSADTNVMPHMSRLQPCVYTW